MRIATVAGLCGMCLVLTWEPWFVGAAAQDRQQVKVQAPAALEPAFQAQLNDHTVSVMAGTNHDGTGTIIQDMAAALDDGTAFRVVPMVGQGPAQTLIDVMALHGVDLIVERGEIVVFDSPADGTRLIKRIVALPGAMTGMILAGATPLHAVLLQLIVGYMLLSAVTITSIVTLELTIRKFFTPCHQLTLPTTPSGASS